jgi:hypothetical protein
MSSEYIRNLRMLINHLEKTIKMYVEDQETHNAMIMTLPKELRPERMDNNRKIWILEGYIRDMEIEIDELQYIEFQKKHPAPHRLKKRCAS